jgi:hypothetical protein
MKSIVLHICRIYIHFLSNMSETFNSHSWFSLYHGYALVCQISTIFNLLFFP